MLPPAKFVELHLVLATMWNVTCCRNVASVECRLYWQYFFIDTVAFHQETKSYSSPFLLALSELETDMPETGHVRDNSKVSRTGHSAS